MKNNFPVHQSSNLLVHSDLHSSIPLNQNDLTSFKQHIEQIPSKDNDFTAICATSITTKDKSISNFGIGTPEMIGGVTDTQQLLEVASYNATQKVANMLGRYSHEPSPIIDIEPPPTYTNPPLSFPQQNTTRQVKYKHSQNKGITDNQLAALERIAVEKRIPLVHVALKTTGKVVESLSSYDANNIFEYYKKI